MSTGCLVAEVAGSLRMFPLQVEENDKQLGGDRIQISVVVIDKVGFVRHEG